MSLSRDWEKAVLKGFTPFKLEILNLPTHSMSCMYVSEQVYSQKDYLLKIGQYLLGNLYLVSSVTINWPSLLDETEYQNRFLIIKSLSNKQTTIKPLKWASINWNPYDWFLSKKNVGIAGLSKSLFQLLHYLPSVCPCVSTSQFSAPSSSSR